MLEGVDPVIIFQFSKLAQSVSSDVGPVQPTMAKIPVISQIPTVIDQPPIPFYLSQALTGIMVDSEDKNVDLETDTETLTNGADPNVNQKGLANVISITLTANKNSIGIATLSALMDQVFDKASSKEYAISYFHGAISIFRGVLHSYGVSQNSTNDLVTLKIELSKGQKQPTKTNPVPTVAGSAGTTPLG